ncbi:hypothetical protein [Micromonospora sp. NPDC002575]|uniref:hypothetical protein n=1 Tax=Micromonospora sp. NPDC002575 TaxID=3364222 RepID=UPI00367810EB
MRIVAPADRSTTVADLLLADPAAAHLAVSPGAARQPFGDLILCDVARESADQVLRRLQEPGVEARGGVSALAYGVWHEAGGSALRVVG